MIRARVQHTYNHVSGLVEHAVVNTFYFHHDLMAPGDLEGDESLELAMHVIDFYDQGAGALQPIRAYLGEASFATQRHTLKVYDLADDEPRAPTITHTTQNGASNGNLPLPAEVALCLSYRGALVSGTNAARRRGRIYLGPCADAGDVPGGSGGFNRPTAEFREAAVASAQKLKDNASADGWVWCVRSGGGGPTPENVADFFTPIQYAYVDDAWDTQRRRGANPTMRTAADLGAITVGFTEN